MSIKQISFDVNKIYSELYTARTRYKDLWGGRGRGGSHAGTEYFLYLLTRPQYFRGYFVRNVFTDIRTSLFQDIKDRIHNNPSLNINDFAFNENRLTIRYRPTGNMIFSKGVSKESDRTASMKSLAGATHVLIEEANELNEEDFDQLDMSIRTSLANEVEVIRVFNPPSKRHWIWRDYTLVEKVIRIKGIDHMFYIGLPKEGRSLTSIFGTYHDNIKNIQQTTIDKFELIKERNPEYYYAQVEGLIPDGLVGKIYSGWVMITNKEFNAINVPSFYAMDFGYSVDPTAVIEVKIHNYNIYARELIYQVGLDNVTLAKMLRGLGISSEDVIVADPGGGGDYRIAELRRGLPNVPGYPDLRFNVLTAYKGTGSVLHGINKIKGFKVHITEDSSNFLYEYSEHAWQIGPDKLPTDRPQDKNNHCLDPLRYAVLADERYSIVKSLTRSR